MRDPLRKNRRGLVITGGAVYLLLLVASHISQRFVTMPVAPPAGSQVQIPPMGREGPEFDDDRTMGMDVFVWGPSPAATDRVPVIMLHGSPGHGADFAFARNPSDPTLEAIFTDDGRTVIAPNLPGFGESLDFPENAKAGSPLRARFVPSYSGRAHAHALLAMMDELGIERAHLLGWSNGGFAAVHMGDIAPERVVSITMLASVGAQETEGSGSYLFEHAKYALGIGAIGGAGELIPHFGLLANRAERIGWLWNFWDTDQRPAGEIMARLATPTLILHGRHDFLTADWNAERHHALMPSSRLVMLDASHFIPFMQTKEAGAVLLEHFARHDTPGAEPLTGYDDRCPRPERAGLGKLWEQAIISLRAVHWIVWIVVLTPFAWALPRVTTAVLALLVAAMTLDFGVATAALWCGAGVSVLRDPKRRTNPAAWLGNVVAVPMLSLTLVWLIAHGNILEPDDGLLGLAFRFWGFGIIASVAIGVLILTLARLLLTPRGWWTLRLLPDRVRRLEFWPSWTLYVAILPRLARLSHKHGGTMTFTCVNPGIPNGGGIIGESKRQILTALNEAEAPVLPFRVIEADGSAEERSLRVFEMLESDGQLGALPVVLKPDIGERGAGVSLARTPEDVRAFFASCPGPAIAQKFHPGPSEFGILWIRTSQIDAAQAGEDGMYGRVFSVTRKARNEVVGDGKRSIKRLISAHPRLRHQRDVLLETVEDPRRVPDADERVAVGHLGNHSFGARFTDGADLITPELELVIDDACRGFRGVDGGELDIGRFDIRCASDDALRRGEGLAIIELNGSTGESTNIYDPERPRSWALGVLGAQWDALYSLGGQRRRLGMRPMGLRELGRLLWRFWGP